MFRSLRFRLPAVFLAGVVLAGLVATLIALRLFQGYTRDQTIADLSQEARAVAQLYSTKAGVERVDAKTLERLTGDRLYFSGVAPGIEPYGPGEKKPALRRLPPGQIDAARLESSSLITFEFTPPDADRTYLAVATPFKIGGHVFGALVAAQPKAELRDRWAALIERLALAFLIGALVAAALGVYLSRRITRPVLALSRAADEVAAGHYEIDVPPTTGGDEIAHLAERFSEMAHRLRETEELERNFLVTVSHELRTPLTAIGGHVAALREGVVEDPDLRAESLEVIAAETTRLERLVGDILDLAKLDAHRFTVLREEVDMERLVEQAYAGFTEEARRRAIDFRRDIQSRPVIESDGDRVLQIISNLLANAFRWTPDGGRIELELTSANGSVNVAVDDTGPGISPQERERVFRPFWSSDRAGGTGLGLAIARELAVALGGRIELQTEQGRGSRFLLVLPNGGGEPYAARPAAVRARR
jgi:signal transduction histidine kinase